MLCVFNYYRMCSFVVKIIIDNTLTRYHEAQNNFIN